MKTAVISFTERGNSLNEEISVKLKADSFKSGKKIRYLTEKIFKEYDAVIFIGAAGIAVRAVAPNIKSKDTDPAVLVCDEAGKFVIPILSGHIGGANSLAEKIAGLVNAVPVITTATDVNGIWAADSWAAKNNMHIENINMIKNISSALLKNERIGIDCDFEISGRLPDNVGFEKQKNGVVVSPFIKAPFENTLNIVPKCICLGVGSKKNADPDSLIELFKTLDISKKAVESIATIDIKKDEPSVKALKDYLNVPLFVYSADELNSANGDFSSSEFVKKITGTNNVCERSAVLTGGKLIVKKQKGNGVTMAAAMKNVEISF